MTFEADLRTRLIDDAIVGPIVETQIYWRIRPQNKPVPAIVLTIVSDPRPQHLEGFHSLRSTRVQLDCYGRTYDETRALRDNVITAIAPYAVIGKTRFDHAEIENVIDRGEDTSVGFQHCHLIDASIWHGKE